ncbi:hypothetical protein GOP47_0014610 [Adiantum capillus-veneris]|uniref:Beclin-1-like protein n=1 Tax=Adiantum capillus-veneris TaxID=13818 RepID=A0A9D4ZDN4_ADICA|nr:hypothetical protein GOP47_0014610 [Adiantum capillus-veneris]
MKAAAGGEAAPGRGFAVDPNLPRWFCQICKNTLCIVGAESAQDPSSRPPIHGLANERMDHSFVVLQKQRVQNSSAVQNRNLIPSSNIAYPSFPPPRPRPPSNAGLPGQGLHHHHPPISEGNESPAARALDESFVVLPSAAASMYRWEPTAESMSSHPPSALGAGVTISQHPGNATFNASIHVLTRVFDIASSQTQVEQPLCLECMRSLCEELDKQGEEIQRDIKAYEAYISTLEKEQSSALSEEEFLKEKQKVEEEERRIEAALEVVELQNEEVVAQLKELDLKSKHFHELEERFWHEFNDFKLQLTVHQDEKDAVLAKIEVAEAQLDMLKRANVLNDAFHIDHDGEFGTINNFRLGRLPNVPVEWEEINAAWGQACLLLFTMAQYCRLNFTYRIIPMGSYPRIADSKYTYELFGPVNLFWSTRYDKAMTLFLACIKEFADFANAKDRTANIPADKCFQLPYKIENDKVEGLTITQSFNRHEKWTKALKYMLCDLKWALYWLIGNTTFQPPTSPSTSLTHGRVRPLADSKGPSRMQSASK